MRKYLLTSVAVLSIIACSKSSSVTGPSTSDIPVVSTPVTSTVDNSTEEVFVSPEEGTNSNPGPTSVDCKNGVCTFTTTNEHWVTAVCTRQLETNDWGSWRGKVYTGFSLTPYDICDPKKMNIDLCEGGEVKIQIDFTAGQGEHIGHLLTKITYEANEEYCPCVDSWIEQEPEVEYSNWSECLQSENQEEGCKRARTKTVTIKEVNSCTEEVRIKSKESSIESEPCECPCVEKWIEEEPVVTYSEWSECKRDENFTTNTNESSCHKSREKTVTIYEHNSCTQERRLKSEETTRETEACECKKEVCPKIPTMHEYLCDNLNSSGEDALAESWAGIDLTRFDENSESHSCAFSDYTTIVALVKSGRGNSNNPNRCPSGQQGYDLFSNVYKFQVLCSSNGSDISHIRYYKCEVDD